MKFKNRTIDEIFEEFNRIHHNKYDYSKAKYINPTTEICIIDPVYGEFWQTPINHAKSSGNFICKTVKDFITKSNQVHNNKYDYSKVPNDVTNKSDIIVICPEHGEFITTFNRHIQNKMGCPKCRHRVKKNDN